MQINVLWRFGVGKTCESHFLNHAVQWRIRDDPPFSQTFGLDDLDDAKGMRFMIYTPKIPQECNLKYRKKWKKARAIFEKRYLTFAKPLVLGIVSMLNLRGVLNMKPVCDKNLKESSQVQNHHTTCEPILLGLKPGFSLMANKSIRSYFIPWALYQPNN